MNKALTGILAAASMVLGFDGEYSTYASVLDKYVCTAGVNYAGLVKDNALEAAAANISSLSKDAYKQMSDKEKIAYLINAYNAYTLLLIKQNYPLKNGIRDIDKPWKKEFVQLLGKKVSLDHIEHEILRKDFNEPRIHFAVNCASIGCPPLAEEPYCAATLDAQLDTAARAFLTDKRYNKVEGKKLKLSKIFKWYGDDFNTSHGGYVNYVKKVLELEGTYRLSFLDYDWNLNKASCN